MKYLYRLAFWMIQHYWRLARPITVGVRLLMIQNGEVILVQHSYDPHWHLPGGGLKRGETLEEAVRREAREEVGGVLADLQLFGVYSSFAQGKSDHVAAFISEQFTWTPPAGQAEIAEVISAPLDALPPRTTPGTKRRLAEYRRHQFPYFGTW